MINEENKYEFKFIYLRNINFTKNTIHGVISNEINKISVNNEKELPVHMVHCIVGDTVYTVHCTSI